ncbi:MAG: hypothetical protein M3Z66_10090 [Chloroflexota bacterium]|nr:hypothetical protein [Chloroflexota bacterium]
MQRIVGRTVFNQGNALQRAGHVLRSAIEANQMRAQVLGTWQRHDAVVVEVAGDSLGVACTCGSSSVCRHGTAVLLQWLRDPASFLDLEDDLDDWSEEGTDTSETIVEEYAALLNSNTMPQLRELARDRGVRVVAQTKSELVAGLAPLLAEPANVDAALAQLTEEDRLTLEAADLANAAEHAAAMKVAAARRLLTGQPGGAAAPPLGSRIQFPEMDLLLDLGLIVMVQPSPYSESLYRVPKAVSNRLGHRELIRPMGPRTIGEKPSGRSPHLTLDEVMIILIHEIRRDTIGHLRLPNMQSDLEPVPAGWLAQLEVQEAAASAQRYAPPNVRLLPWPNILSSTDLSHLSTLLGRPTEPVSGEQIEFVIELMVVLGIVEVAGSRLHINDEHWMDLLALPRSERAAQLLSAWLSMSDPSELGAIVSDQGPFRLHFNPGYYNSGYYADPGPSGPGDSAVRRLTARIIERLRLGTPPSSGSATDKAGWYSFDSLLALLHELVPTLLTGPKGQGYATWWFTKGKSGKRLNLERLEEWQEIWSPLVAAILTGPMRWLGVVEVDMRDSKPIAFRPLPVGGPRDTAGAGSAESIEILMEEGVPVLTAPTGADGSLHLLLGTIGEPIGVSDSGLSYRLSGERIQSLFEDGATAQDIIGTLAGHLAEVPPAVCDTIDRWWSGYGAIRLYDDVTLMELSDDTLLRELLVTSSLGNALLFTLSPNVVAIDPEKVTDLMNELERLGHTPKIVEEG